MKKKSWYFFKVVVYFSLVVNLLVIGFLLYEMEPEFNILLIPLTQIAFHIFNLRLYKFHQRNNELPDWSTDVCHTFLAIVTAFFSVVFCFLFAAAIKDFSHYGYDGNSFKVKQYIILTLLVLTVVSNLYTIIASILLRCYLRDHTAIRGTGQ